MDMNIKDYDVFKALIIDGIKRNLLSNYPEYEVQTKNVYQINSQGESISLVPSIKVPGAWISQNISLDRLYSAYRKGVSLDKILGNVIDILRKTINDHGMENNHNLDTNKIIFHLINTEQNLDMLANIPHRQFMDLSIVYRYIYDVGEESMVSDIISFDLAEMNGLQEESLYKLAYQNTKELMPVKLEKLEDKIRQLYKEMDMPDFMIDMMLGDIPQDSMKIYVLTNDQGTYGAASLLYTEQLAFLAMLEQKDLYILPSSLHEVLIVPKDDNVTEEVIGDMVYTVNMAAVELEDRLSNETYYYNRKDKELSQLSDYPIKSLDDRVVFMMDSQKQNRTR